MKRTKLHALNPESARKRIKAARSSKTFMTALMERDHPKHEEAVGQWTRLHEVAFQEPYDQPSPTDRDRVVRSSRVSLESTPVHATSRRRLNNGRSGTATHGSGSVQRTASAAPNARLRRPPARFAKQAGPSLEEQDDWTEHWFAKGRHFYDRISPPVCAASECNLEDVVAVLNETGVHPNQSEEFFPGQPYVGDVDIFGPFGRDDVSTVAIFDSGIQVGVRNETLENHKLHPGTVERTVILKDGSYHIRTQGEGTGRLGGPNVMFDDVVWGKVDRQVIDAFR